MIPATLIRGAKVCGCNNCWQCLAQYVEENEDLWHDEIRNDLIAAGLLPEPTTESNVVGNIAQYGYAA
jgi:hypothetical protein